MTFKNEDSRQISKPLALPFFSSLQIQACQDNSPRPYKPKILQVFVCFHLSHESRRENTVNELGKSAQVEKNYHQNLKYYKC